MRAHGAAYGRQRPRRQRAARAVLLALLALLGTKAAPARPLHLLVLGDSLAAGYGLPRAAGFEAQLAAALRERRQDVLLVDGAVSGDTSTDAAARLDWVLAGDPVDAALVELGGNDALRALDPETMRRNLAYIVDGLVRRRIPVLLSGMLAPPSLGSEYDRRFAAAFAAVGRRPGVAFDAFFLADVWGHPTLMQTDGLHPNAAGVAVEVGRLLPAVERLLAQTGAARPAGVSLR